MGSEKHAPEYTVIVDTREQEGYFFKKFDKCKGAIRQKLDTGDYSIQGLEDKLCIERKGSIEELAINLGYKKATFYREIDRMKTYNDRFIVLEFSLDDLIKYPDKSRIPEEYRDKVKITGKYMLRCLMEFQVNDGINVVFCGNKENSFYFVGSLLKRINEKYFLKEHNDR